MTSVGPDEVLAVLVAFISYVRTYDIMRCWLFYIPIEPMTSVGPDEVLAV